MSRAPPRQRGISLLVSLILLAVLSVATVSAMQSAGLHERVAGNARDRTLAFNSAESALRDAEEYLRTDSNLPLFDGNTRGHYRANEFPGLNLSQVAPGTAVDGSSVEVWRDPASIAFIRLNGIVYGSRTGVGSLPQVTEQPRYVIEMMPRDSSRPVTYRITAWATGRDSSLVVLQNFYTPPQKTVF